jgi:glycosyltransferase involved in cell wall biosynthesis
MVEEGIGGYLVAPSDPDALAAAIRRLAKDRMLSRRMGEHNRDVCREKFGFATVFASLDAIYERIVSSGPERHRFRSLLRPHAPATAGAGRRRQADP